MEEQTQMQIDLEKLEELFSFLGEPSNIQIPEDDEEEERPAIPCGSVWKWYVNPVTGLEQSYPLTCGKFRVCIPCHNRRRDDFIRRITTATQRQHKLVGVLKLSIGEEPNEAARAVVEAVTKDDYLRLPSDDGGALFFDTMAYTGEDNSRELPEDTVLIINEKDITKLDGLFDWDDLTNTPEGSRPSGNLGKIDLDAEREKSDQWQKIEVDTLEVNSRHEAKVRIAFEEAVADTAGLDPKTPEEVETAINQRTDAVVERLRAWKVAIRKRGTKKAWIKVGSIEWKENSHIYVTMQNSTHGKDWTKGRQKLLEEMQKPPAT